MMWMSTDIKAGERRACIGITPVGNVGRPSHIWRMIHPHGCPFSKVDNSVACRSSHTFTTIVTHGPRIDRASGFQIPVDEGTVMSRHHDREEI